MSNRSIMKMIDDLCQAQQNGELDQVAWGRQVNSLVQAMEGLDFHVYCLPVRDLAWQLENQQSLKANPTARIASDRIEEYDPTIEALALASLKGFVASIRRTVEEDFV